MKKLAIIFITLATVNAFAEVCTQEIQNKLDKARSEREVVQAYSTEILSLMNGKLFDQFRNDAVKKAKASDTTLKIGHVLAQSQMALENTISSIEENYDCR